MQKGTFNLKIANVLMSDSWGEIGPAAFERGIGGREGAMIFLSREWAKMGHEVTSFVPVERGERFSDEGYHEYIPLNLTRPMLANFDWDVAIAWECPSAFDDPRVKERIGTKITEMQVAHLSPKEAEAAANNCDYLAALSEWHADFLLHSGIEFEKENVVAFPNGVDIERYPQELVTKKFSQKIGDNPKFVYSSSPDRGLWYLLQSWPHIRKRFPNAELLICYGVKGWVEHLKWSHGRIGEMALSIEKLIDQPGVTDLGKIGQDTLANLQLEADAWLYPLDSIQSTETGCITAVENAAAANPIITTDCDCMEDEFGAIGNVVPLPFDPEYYAEKVAECLLDEDLVEYQREIGRAFAEKRNWSLIANSWIDFFKSQS